MIQTGSVIILFCICQGNAVTSELIRVESEEFPSSRGNMTDKLHCHNLRKTEACQLDSQQQRRKVSCLCCQYDREVNECLFIMGWLCHTWFFLFLYLLLSS
jgi:hypothetical protein